MAISESSFEIEGNRNIPSPFIARPKIGRTPPPHAHTIETRQDPINDDIDSKNDEFCMLTASHYNLNCNDNGTSVDITTDDTHFYTSPSLSIEYPPGTCKSKGKNSSNTSCTTMSITNCSYTKSNTQTRQSTFIMVDDSEKDTITSSSLTQSITNGTYNPSDDSIITNESMPHSLSYNCNMDNDDQQMFLPSNAIKLMDHPLSPPNDNKKKSYHLKNNRQKNKEIEQITSVLQLSQNSFHSCYGYPIIDCNNKIMANHEIQTPKNIEEIGMKRKKKCVSEDHISDSTPSLIVDTQTTTVKTMITNDEWIGKIRKEKETKTNCVTDDEMITTKNKTEEMIAGKKVASESLTQLQDMTLIDPDQVMLCLQHFEKNQNQNIDKLQNEFKHRNCCVIL